MQDALFSTSAKGGGQMFFFDIKQALNGKQSKYLQVSQSWITKDQQKKRSTITIFSDQIETFQKAFEEAKANI